MLKEGRLLVPHLKFLEGFRLFYKRAVLKNFEIFRGKQLCPAIVFNKVLIFLLLLKKNTPIKLLAILRNSSEHLFQRMLAIAPVFEKL